MMAQAKKQADSSRRRSGPLGENVSERHLDEWLAVAAHELRSPLGAIRCAVQALRGAFDNAEDRAKLLGVLDRQTAHMSCLIEQLLELRHIRRGTAQLRTTLLDVTEQVRAAIETVWPRLVDARHDLEVDLPAGPVMIEADPSRLRQMIVNLLTNAAKYTKRGGRIEVSLVADHEEVVIRVRDSGIGIAPENLPHVFDLFWRSSRAASHCELGLGIGLALVRQNAVLHGGSVSAASAGPGQGSEFTIHLPREKPNSARARASGRSARSQAAPLAGGAADG
jgi:signal transduction histidine kinase